MRFDVLYFEDQIDGLEARLSKIRGECAHEQYQISLGCVGGVKSPVRRCVECGEVLTGITQAEAENFWSSIEFNTDIAYPS